MKVGYARLEITAPLGTVINGWSYARISDGILDELYATAIAFSDGERTAVAITLDILEMRRADNDIIRNMIAERYGIEPDAVLVHCTHSHYTPEVSGVMFERSEEYRDYFFKRVTDAAGFAIADMKEATAFIGKEEAKGACFVRRFIMKDGSCKMNPPKDDPNIVCRENTPDETVQFVKIVREGGHDVVIVNFGAHPCSLGAETKFSADYVHFVRLTLEQALADEADGKGAKVAFFDGAEGDTGTIDIYAPKRGYKAIRHTGRLIASAVLRGYTYAEPVNTDKVFYEVADLIVPSINDVTPDRPSRLSCLGFGEVAFIGLPGEPFCEIGKRIKAGSAFKMTMPTCNTNDWISYIAMPECVPRGGYGASGVDEHLETADMLINKAIELSKKYSK